MITRRGNHPAGWAVVGVMLAASHIVVGAATGAACRRAWVAVPAAFVSHFVMDQIPHSCLNMYMGKALSAPAEAALAAGLALDGAIIVAAVVLAWRLRNRWVALAAGLAAFLPDPLSYQQPLCNWFAMLPGSWVVPWAHRAFHCDVTRTQPLLGFATQVVVILLAVWVLKRKPRKT